MNDTDHTAEVQRAIDAARAVMADHVNALNQGDEAALAATLHFPHYRLAGSEMTVWDTAETYLADFHARAGTGWHHSAWDALDVIAAEPAKVHLDVRFTRFREDGSAMGSFRSLWVLSDKGGVWAAQLRSSFAP